MSFESLSNNLQPKCVYVNEKNGQLSEDGMETVVLNGKVKCRVYHLTDFTTIPIVKSINQPTSSSSVVKPKASSSSKKTVLGSASSTSLNFGIVVILMLIIGMM